MHTGEDLTITVGSVTDVAGNVLDGAGNSAIHVGGALGVAPLVTVHGLSTNGQTPRLTGVAFDAGGLGSISVTVNSVVYTAVLTDLGSGQYEWYADVTSDLPYGTYEVLASALDAAGNPGVDSTTNELVVDVSLATTVDNIATVESSPTRAATVHFTVRFSEPVTGVDTADFVIEPGSIADAAITGVTGSGDTWTVTVTTGTSSGYLTIDLIDNNTILDNLSHPLGGPALNDGDFTESQSYTIDHDRPQVTLVASAAVTKTAPIPVSITFSENVSGFAVWDLVASHATLSGFTKITPSRYSVKLTPSPSGYQGALTLTVPAGSAQDAVGNGNLVSSPFSVIYDTVPPTLSVSAPTELVAQSGTVSYFVTYSGASSVNLTMADVYLIRTGTANGGISAILENGLIREIVIDNFSGMGTLSIRIAPGTSADAAGNRDAGLAAGIATPFHLAPPMPVAGGLGLALLTGVFAWTSARRVRRK
jgi:hypothetical protein